MVWVDSPGIIFLVAGLALIAEAVENAVVMAIKTLRASVIPLGNKTCRMALVGSRRGE